MVKIKYTGNGMFSRGIDFSPTRTDGLYDVSEEDSKYFLETFPNQFVLIEAKKEATPPPKNPRAKRTKAKSTDTPEG